MDFFIPKKLYNRPVETFADPLLRLLTVNISDQLVYDLRCAQTKYAFHEINFILYIYASAENLKDHIFDRQKFSKVTLVMSKKDSSRPQSASVQQTSNRNCSTH